MRKCSIGCSVAVGLFCVNVLQASWTVSPTGIDFGSQTVGVPPVIGTVVTVNNTGNTNLTLSTVTISAPFILRTGTVPNMIAAHAYSPPTLTFAFAPTAPGTYNGNAVIFFDDGTFATIPLSGTAVTTTAAVSVSSASLSFGQQVLGSPSPSQSVTLTNTGTATVKVLGFASVPSVFAQAPAAQTTITPGSQIRVPMTFTPTALGAVSGNLNIQFDVLRSIGITLSGTGVAPAAIAITSPPTLPAATVNATYQAFPAATGGVPPLTWSLVSGALPNGLSLSSSGVISGVPRSTGTSTFTMRATDSLSASATQKATIKGYTSIPANCGDISFNVAGTSTPLVPLNDLGTGTYLGSTGGLYPGGSNVRPDAQTTSGVSLAQSIGPLDANGNSSPTGQYVMIALGTSDANDEFNRFLLEVNTYSGKNPQLVIVNGAAGLESSSALSTPGNGYIAALVNYFLPNNGVTANQVVALWMELAVNSPTGTFPSDNSKLESQIETILRAVQTTFPNIKLAYLSSRVYGGYSNGISPQSPEPYAYEDGFAMQFVISDQLNGNPVLNYDPSKGAVVAPWLSWGPYYWANGLIPRSDGLVWTCQDFIATGTHPSDPAGRQKVADALFTFFTTDPTATPWFLAH